MPTSRGSVALPPAPPASSVVAQQTMRANRSRDTKPELDLRSELHRRGLRFHKNARIAELGNRRSVDIVFPRKRVAVFVHGCFWHGCPEHLTWPKANAGFWRAKIQRNQERDHATGERLRESGWTVVEVWEHEPAAAAADRVADAISQRQASSEQPPPVRD